MVKELVNNEDNIPDYNAHFIGMIMFQNKLNKSISTIIRTHFVKETQKEFGVTRYVLNDDIYKNAILKYEEAKIKGQLQNIIEQYNGQKE